LRIRHTFSMPGDIRTALHSPDGTRMVTASTDSNARLWDVATGREVVRALPHRSGVQFAEYSRDGKLIVTASAGGEVRVWDAATGQPLMNPLLHDGPVNLARFSPDGSIIASGSEDRCLRLWDAGSGKLLRLPMGDTADIPCLSFAPDGKHVAAMDYSYRARLIPLPRYGPVPAWFCEFAETIAGVRLDDAGRATPAGMDIERVKSARLTDTGSDLFAQTARWFFQRGPNRPIHPGAQRSSGEYARHLISLHNDAGNREALRAAPGDAEIIHALREQLAPPK
jgi:dipeptidyl aminopeptidase/acylaminoacyl peptidase